MEGAHLHLILNHVPFFSLIFGTALLAISMKRKSADLRTVASILFLITGLMGWVAAETGEQAEDAVKTLNLGTESFIEQHELAADWAQGSGILLAVLAIGLEVSVRKKPNWTKGLEWLLLVLAIHGCSVFARTLYLGGQIRHTEIRS